jgi:CRISPR-associated protein Cas1
VHTIILDNYKAVITVQLINSLTMNNVNVVTCGVDHLPVATMLPLRGNAQAASMLKCQLKWSTYLKEYAQREIVKAKIYNQIKLLKYFEKSEEVISKVQRFYDTVVLGDKTNREGLSAKMYFRELFGKKFIRFSKTTKNAALNYGYAILRSQISQAIIAKGLNPSLGLFHKGANNFFNLSDDIIEPFRPIVDKYVYDFIDDEMVFNTEHKVDLLKHLTKNIYFKSVSQTIFNVIRQYVDHIVNFMETGEITNGIEHPTINYGNL